MSQLLEIRDLTVQLMTANGPVYAINGVNLDVAHGEIHGLVGESGCGKSVTSKAIMRLLDNKRSRVTGTALLDGTDLLSLPERRLPQWRGKEMSMIFQEPMTSLSPLKTVGAQLQGAVQNHTTLSRTERQDLALSLLERVGLSPAEKRAKQYPFELSGGMQQRVMIAQAVACHPKLLIADEPTTALDVTVQAQILALLRELQGEYGMSVLLVTHNFGVVAQICDRVSVMYAGQVIETANTQEMLSSPLHPYSRALIDCIPRGSGGSKRLVSLPGAPPRLYSPEKACPFLPRCKYQDEKCQIAPELRCIGNHFVACHHFAETGTEKGGI
jgi:oligopeptide/dipeptide ABC transporter ATP-binding protein